MNPAAVSNFQSGHSLTFIYPLSKICSHPASPLPDWLKLVFCIADLFDWCLGEGIRGNILRSSPVMNPEAHEGSLSWALPATPTTSGNLLGASSMDSDIQVSAGIYAINNGWKGTVRSLEVDWQKADITVSPLI